MAIDKALNQAPLGLQEDDVLAEGPEIEIEIEDPEAIRVGVDGMPLIEIEKEEGDAMSGQPMEGEEMAMDGLPVEPPTHTRSLRGKVDAARFAAAKMRSFSMKVYTCATELWGTLFCCAGLSNSLSIKGTLPKKRTMLK